MRLVEIDFAPYAGTLPARVSKLLADAAVQIAALEEQSRASIPAFVPSDFELIYRALAAIKSDNLATGRRLLEWGSGTGVVTCLAVALDFDAAGIEIESKLVRLAQELAKKHRLAAQFVCGSFVPVGSEPHLDLAADVTWLSSGGSDGYEQLQLEPDDFDVVFAYPWPGEEQVIFNLFADCAAVGALLLTYHGQDGLRLQRKVRR
jgi:predicted O-methyltransferase YrrM